MSTVRMWGSQVLGAPKALAMRQRVQTVPGFALRMERSAYFGNPFLVLPGGTSQPPALRFASRPRQH